MVVKLKLRVLATAMSAIHGARFLAGKMRWVSKILGQPAFWSAIAATFSATAAWLTYSVSNIPNDRISLVVNSHNDLTDWEDHVGEFRFDLIDLGNRGFLFESMKLIELAGVKTTNDSCRSASLSTLIDIIEMPRERFPSMTRDLGGGIGRLTLLEPVGGASEEGTRQRWVAPHDAFGLDLAFNIQAVDNQKTVVLCPVVEFISPQGMPVRAICSGWYSSRPIEPGQTGRSTVFGPFTSVYDRIFPRTPWPRGCVVSPRGWR